MTAKLIFFRLQEPYCRTFEDTRQALAYAEEMVGHLSAGSPEVVIDDDGFYVDPMSGVMMPSDEIDRRHVIELEGMARDVDD